MVTNATVFWQIAQSMLALFGAAYILVPLIEWKRRIALRQSVIFKRVVTWSLIGVVFMLALAGGLPALAVLFIFIARQAASEYTALAHLDKPYAFLLRESAVVVMLVAVLSPAAFPLLALCFLLSLTIPALVTQKVDGAVEQIARAMLGFVWIHWTLGHALLLARLPDGVVWLLLVALGVSLSDVSAGTLGMLFGRRKLAPVISPGKTWAGAVGNFVGAALAFALMQSWLPAQNMTLLAALIGVIAIGSLWGDLIESLVKRACGVKDAGKLLPGFGGILDRIDSLMVVLPSAFYLLTL